MKLTFKGKRATVLGATSDLGIEISQRFIEEGIFPVLTVRNSDREKMIHTALKAYEGAYETHILDMNEKSGCSHFFKSDAAPCDYWVDLINGDIEFLVGAISDETLLSFMTRHIAHHALLVKAAARHMLKNRRGRLVYISSTAAVRSNPGQGFYAASKRSMEALYQSLGIELGSKGVTSVILRPGYIDAGRGRRFLKKKPESIRQRVPIKRALTKREVAETILFFLSDSALGFNASTHAMDGGLSAAK